MKKAFTLVEVIVTLVVFTIVLSSVLTIYLNSQRTKQKVDAMISAQQAARNAIDYMIKDIRAAGYNIDLQEDATSTPQRRIVFASPYTLVFNANLNPTNDNPESPLSPQAYDPASTPKPKLTSSLVYNPNKKYETGAETVVYTLDYNNDGIIGNADKNVLEAKFTDNPNDYVLVKRVYGFNTADNTNGGENQIISIVGGPDQFPSQTTGTPIFLYWYDDDNDPSTDNILWGDTDNNGEISQTEANNLTPITDKDILDKIRLITINITGISPSKVNGEYIETNIITDVSVTRNASINVQIVTGHVYEDTNGDGVYDVTEPGLENFKVRLNTGEMTYTDANGYWSFALISGTYSATCTPEVGYSPTTDLYFDFTVGDNDLDLTSENEYKDYFGFEETPTATIIGFAFVDNNANGTWESDEPWLDSVVVAVWNNSAVTMSGDTNDPNYGTYSLTINAEETTYVWAYPKYGYSPSGVDTYILGIADTLKNKMTYFEIIDEGSFAIDAPEDSQMVACFGMVEATGAPPYIEVLNPNGGERLIIDDSYPLEIKVYDSDGNIISLEYYLSINGGDDWSLIDKITYPIIPSDSLYTNTWSVELPDTFSEGSTICILRVVAKDDSNWTVYDDSDNYFTIVGEGGYRSLFFTVSTVDSVLDEYLYLKSLGSTPDSTLPKYLNTLNSYSAGIVADSFNFNGWQSMRPFYTQASKYAEWVTSPLMPYADTIYPGVWKFFLVGWTDDDDTETKYFEVEVYRVDSTGANDTLIFSTDVQIPYLRSNIGNAAEVETLYVNVPYGFPMDRSDRLYVKLFWSGSSSNTGGPSGSIDAHIQFLFGEINPSRMILPPQP